MPLIVVGTNHMWLEYWDPNWVIKKPVSAMVDFEVETDKKNMNSDFRVFSVDYFELET